jgi:hypothetical protein
MLFNFSIASVEIYSSTALLYATTGSIAPLKVLLLLSAVN